MSNYIEQTGREQALEQEVVDLKKEVQRQQDLGQGYYDSMMTFKEELNTLKERADSLVATIQRLKRDPPTMPVIPKAVAIAIFQEGVQSGVRNAIAELEGQSINIDEREYIGDFEVSFARSVDLDDHLNFDWMRDKVGQYNSEFVEDALKGLCALNEFECRIHGIDDQEQKNND